MGIFQELGKAIAASGKGAEYIAEGYGKVLGGIGSAIGTLGNDLASAQSTRHETTRLRDQQTFLLRYQHDRAEINKVDREASHRHRQEKVRLEYDLRQQDRMDEAAIKLFQIEALDHLERSMENSPFRYGLARVFADAQRESDGGRRPVLLIAPFINDPDQDDMAGEVLRCTDQLIRHEVTGRLAGAFRRPLDLVDTDVNTIRDTLDGLPGILVSGEFDGNGRILVTVTGWDLIGAAAAGGTSLKYSVHRTALPPVDLPSGPLSKQKRREARRQVAIAAVFLAAAYADLFHVAQGEMPRLYADMPEYLRGDVAVGSTAMLDVAAAQGMIDPVDASLAQAGVYLDVGQDDRVRKLLLDVLVALLDKDAVTAADWRPYLARVRRAKTLLIRAGLTAEAKRLDAAQQQAIELPPGASFAPPPRAAGGAADVPPRHRTAERSGRGSRKALEDLKIRVDQREAERE